MKVKRQKNKRKSRVQVSLIWLNNFFFLAHIYQCISYVFEPVKGKTSKGKSERKNFGNSKCEEKVQYLRLDLNIGNFKVSITLKNNI